jgi:RHS repeat-associated protein
MHFVAIVHACGRKAAMQPVLWQIGGSVMLITAALKFFLRGCACPTVVQFRLVPSPVRSACVLLFFLCSAAAAQDRITYFVNDATRSPVAALDSSGSVIWRADYDPFGRIVSTTGTISTQRRWLGAKLDSESGLMPMGARNYYPNIGRFLSVDPLLFGDLPPVNVASPSRLNAYAYGLNNPLRFTDLSGALPVDIRPEGYAYTKTSIIGSQPRGNFVLSVPQIAMGALQNNPSAFFPFDVIGANGETSLYEGGLFYLMARPGSPFPFPPGRNPVRVKDLTDSSFTFVTQIGHFDPEGSTIRFSVFTDDAGNAVLKQTAVAWADHTDVQRPLFLLQLAPQIADMGWDIQAAQLRSYLSTGRVPQPWPARR